MIFSIPAMLFENEFISLDLVAKMVDSLLDIDPGYALVYQWNGDSMKGQPDVILMRVGSSWEIVPRA